jgi:hypothetical protein
MGNPLQTTVTLWEAKRCFKVADEENRKLKVNALFKRQEFLRDHAQDKALSMETLKQAKQALGYECQQDNARCMKHLRGKQHEGAVTWLGQGVTANEMTTLNMMIKLQLNNLLSKITQHIFVLQRIHPLWRNLFCQSWDTC